MKKLSLVLILSVLVLSSFVSVNSNKANFPEDRYIHSGAQWTTNLHNVGCSNVHLCVDDWAADEFTFSVTAPLGYTFVSEPELEFLGGEVDALRWNNFGPNHRWTVVQSDNSRKIIRVQVGSKSLLLGIKCLARKS